MRKQCRFCGQFFSPDPRVGTRQQACPRTPCRKARKKQAQQRWRQNNPGYFRHHYQDYVKPWRQRRRALRQQATRGVEVIKDEIGSQRLILLIPAGCGGMIKDEILLRRLDRHTFAVPGP
ncbi:MAG TPA: hypothetical protein VEM15_11245 [Thermodesulfobacteriota bacterium]|nr:hypothetical protein [Thermodesulfobacteriota bacterium]